MERGQGTWRPGAAERARSSAGTGTWLAAPGRFVGAAIACVLALSFALRLAALPLLIPEADGRLVPICEGGRIVYVALGPDGPVEREGLPKSDPCPVFGLAQILAADPPETPAPAPAARPPRARLFRTSRPARRPARAHPPRAPPATG